MYLVKGELLQAIANYLKTRPFEEVAVFMAELGKLKPVPPAAKPTPPPPEEPGLKPWPPLNAGE